MIKFDVKGYQISFWNYVSSHLQGEDMVNRMREMGCSLYMAPEHKREEGLPNVYRVLEKCEQYKMPCILYDHRVTLKAFRESGEEQYIRNLKEVNTLYGKFSSAAYLFICDEPNSDEDYKATARACALMREYIPEIHPFVSLNHVGMRSEQDADRVLEFTAQDLRPDFLLYNCYSQCMEEETDKLQGLENYFHNLAKFMQIGKRYDLPVWQSLILVGHMCLAEPTQAQIRWQLNVAAAHGVKGFFWFHPIELGYSYDFRGYAIDCKGKTTPRFDILSYENNRFMEDIAARLCNYKHEKTFHLHLNSGDHESFYKDRDDLIADVYTDYNRPLVIGKFSHITDASRRAVMLVNASQEKVCHVRISFGGTTSFTDRFYLSAGSAKIYEFQN